MLPCSGCLFPTTRYADLHNDPRRKQLTLQKKPSRSVRMTRKKVSSGKHGKSGRGDKVIIRDVALMSKGISSFRRALNTRAGSARARALWGRVANHLRVVLHLDPGLSKCIDGSFKFNRSMFVGAALMLQEAADLGCEARVAHPYKFWKQLGRANYEAFRCTLMPMFLDRAHVALQRALVFLANLSSVDVWLSTGMVYVRHASWKGAAQVFARIIQDYPRYDAMNEVVFQAACVMAQLNMLKQGLAYFQAVLGRPPKPYAELHVQLAMAQLQRAAGMEGIATDTFRDVHKQLKRRKKKRQEARWQRIFGVVEAERGRLKPRRLMFPPHGVLARMKALDDMLGESAKAAETADEWLATGRPWALMGQLYVHACLPAPSTCAPLTVACGVSACVCMCVAVSPASRHVVTRSLAWLSSALPFSASHTATAHTRCSCPPPAATPPSRTPPPLCLWRRRSTPRTRPSATCSSA